MVSQPGEGDVLRSALEAKLQGQYRIVRLLGRGGMGAVYLARDLTLEREVAIKVISGAAPELYERFRREAKTAAKLSHPHIVPLHAFGEIDGLPYFIMGYVRGESLAARLRREGRLREDEARRILAEIAGALDHAHRHGVVHRDVKPDNVLLDDESGRALLTDFGVARSVDKGETLTRIGGIVGTPHYMSPEQASGNAVIDGRSDIYSLGVMGYVMLTGRLPFEGSTPGDVLTKHLTQAPPALRPLAPEASDATLRAIERCLAKDPAARWQDGASLMRELGFTSDEEHDLPEDLRALRGLGVAGLFVLPGVWLAGSGPDAGIGDSDAPMILAFFVTAWLLAHVAIVIRLRVAGIAALQSLRVMYMEPSWWPLWFPRRLRRAGNVWDRLPLSVRVVRSWYCAWILFVFYQINAIHRFSRGAALGEIFTVLSVVVGTWLVLIAIARMDLKRKGLTGGDAQRVAFAVPPSRTSFWSRPHIAVILAPSAADEHRRSDSPNDQLQSILRHANELSGPFRALGAQAAVAARQLLASIEDADRQIASLAQSIEPGEEERLTEKISALTHEEHAPLRSLLEQQVELLRSIAAQIEEVKERRNRRIEMLKMLALHLASLRGRLSTAPAEAGAMTDNVRAICEEIARQSAAFEHRTTIVSGEEMPTVERTPRVR